MKPTRIVAVESSWQVRRVETGYLLRAAPV